MDKRLVDLKVSARFASFIRDWDYETYLCIGGYGSGKSYAVAQKIILKLMEEKRKALVVRDVFATMKDSCFDLLKSVIDDLGMSDEIIAVYSPMEIRFPNGSKIIFRGMDKPEKIKSLNGVSIVWLEECSEIRYDAYKELLGRIRENKVSLHFILSCNPVGKENWVYNNFFVRTDDNGNDVVICDENKFYKKRTLLCKTDSGSYVYYHHSVADDNPFLPQSYIRRLDGLKKTDKQLWVVARWGRFGANGTRVLPNFVVAKDAKAFRNAVNNISAHYHFFGLDFGFEDSYNALVSCCVDIKKQILYIYDEVYVNHVTDDIFCEREDVRKVARRATLCEKPIYADSAEPKTIQFYRQKGYNMARCKKYAGSRLQNTKKMKRFNKIVCSPKCKNAIKELKDLTYKKDSRGNAIYDTFNIDAHTFSALWYALDKYNIIDLKEIQTNSKAG